MRQFLPVLATLLSTSSLLAHPGHGAVEHHVNPIVHHIISVEHLAVVLLVVLVTCAMLASQSIFAGRLRPFDRDHKEESIE